MLLSTVMRKRWRLILFWALAAIFVVAIAWPRPPDEYAFLEKYHPIRKLEQLGGPGSSGWFLIFVFPKSTPELLAELGPPVTYKAGRVTVVTSEVRLRNGVVGNFDRKSLTLTIEGVPGPSWISIQWEGLKRRLGMERTPEAQSHWSI